MTEAIGQARTRAFTKDEEAFLQLRVPTNELVKAGAKTTVNIRAQDPTWRQVKTRQQDELSSAEQVDLGKQVFDLAVAAAEGTALEALATAAGPVVTLALSAKELVEAHEKAAEQTEAVSKDQAHVALIATLNLPTGYKAKRLDQDYRDVPKGPHDAAFRATQSLSREPRIREKLQLHCDRGMNGAAEAARLGVSKEQYFASHPEVGAAYQKDAAFREGFDGYAFTKAHGTPDEMKAVDQYLQKQDGWYARANVQVRA